MSSPEDGEHQRPELILTLTSDPLQSPRTTTNLSDDLYLCSCYVLVEILWY